MKYLLPLILVLSLNTGCGTVKTLLGVNAIVDKPGKVITGEVGGVIDKFLPKSKAEKNIDLYLGIAAGLSGLAIVLGAIIFVVQLLSTGKWRLGAGLWGGGIVGIVGLQIVAVILGPLKWLVVILLIIVVVGLAGWLGYQLFVLKRSFRQIIAGFQIAKVKDWTKETKAEIETSYAPATKKLVAAVKDKIKEAA